jgi:PAS domain S-box-containing protein
VRDQRDQSAGHQGQLDLELARQALRESEARYRALVDASPAGILVVQDGRWLFANAMILRELGLSSLDDLRGRPVLDIVQPESHTVVLERWRRVDVGQPNPPADINIRRADGTTVVVESSSVPIEVDGRPAALVTVRDVSEERRARREREIALRLLHLLNLPGDTRDLAQSVAAFVRQECDCDAAGLRWRDANGLPYVESRAEAVDSLEDGRCLADRDVPAPDDAEGRPALDCLCGRILEGEVPVDAPGFAPSGSFLSNDVPSVLARAQRTPGAALYEGRCNVGRYGSAAIIPLRHGNRVLGLLHLHSKARGRFSPASVGFLESMAGQVAIALAQRQGQAALAASERRLRRLAQAIEQAAEAIVITGVDGAIEYVNPAFERATGYLAEEVSGQNLRLLKSGRHDASFYKGLWDTVLSGAVWSGRVVNRRKDGSLYTEDSTIAPVKDERGRVERFVAVKRDVSHEIELEAQFRQAQKLESVGRLAAGVAHDLNNLLLPILGYAELLMAADSSHRAAGSPVDEIRQAAERSRDLVRQLLAFARKQVLETRCVDLRDVVAGMEPLIRRTLTENIELRVQLPGEPVPAVVDKGQVEQVLMNLVVNAHDAMPHGGLLAVGAVRVTLGVSDKAAPGLRPGDYACLFVSDSGHGMPPDVRAQIFEPFYTTKGTAGTGLGLATVYGIVKQHGGAISVESLVGEGATFRVFLPLAAERARSATPVEPAGAARAARGTGTILVVEDNDQVRRLTCAILAQHGYEVRVASSGQAAEEIVGGDGPVDLLLTDVVMPDVNGRELYRRLAARRPGLRAVFMSGYAPEFVLGDERDRPLFFLRKPFTVGELTAKVREALDSAIME